MRATLPRKPSPLACRAAGSYGLALDFGGFGALRPGVTFCLQRTWLLLGSHRKPLHRMSALRILLLADLPDCPELQVLVSLSKRPCYAVSS